MTDQTEGSRDEAADSEDFATLRRVVGGAAEAIGRTIMANGGNWEAAPDSQYAREVSEQGPFVGQSQAPVANAYSGAFVRHSAALLHVVDLERLLAPPPTVHGPASILRTVMENSAWAWWALDPDIDVKRRIARGISQTISNLTEVIRFPSPGVQSDAIGKRETLAADAEALGFRVQRKEGGTPVWVEEKPPSITRLIETQLGEDGTIAYRELSAVAHGTLFGLMARMKKSGIDLGQPGISLMEPAAPVGILLYSLAIVLESFWQAGDRRFLLYGWDVSPWDRWKVESKIALLPVLKRNSESS